MIRWVLRYLLEHPDAKDTKEGIIRWWLPKGEDEPEEGEIQRAIGSLISKEWLIMRKTRPSRTIYGVNKVKLNEIRAFLGTQAGREERDDAGDRQG